MTGGDAYRAKLLTPEALDAAIATYLADPSKPVVLEIGKGSLDVAAAILAPQVVGRRAGGRGCDTGATAERGEDGDTAGEG